MAGTGALARNSLPRCTAPRSPRTTAPGASLFFGRIDQQRRDAPTPERWYIGRRHVADSHGDPVVIDWRAGVSTAFYRAAPAEPMGVILRRRFGIDRGQLTAYEDER